MLPQRNNYAGKINRTPLKYKSLIKGFNIPGVLRDRLWRYCKWLERETGEVWTGWPALGALLGEESRIVESCDMHREFNCDMHKMTVSTQVLLSCTKTTQLGLMIYLMSTSAIFHVPYFCWCTPWFAVYGTIGLCQPINIYAERDVSFNSLHCKRDFFNAIAFRSVFNKVWTFCIRTYCVDVMQCH